MAIDELGALSLSGQAHLLNNFRLREDVGFFSGRSYIELSFSAVNRSSSPLFLSVQFLGLGREESGHEPIIALSAEPMLGLLGGNEGDQISASVNVERGELASIGAFCVRVDT